MSNQKFRSTPGRAPAGQTPDGKPLTVRDCPLHVDATITGIRLDPQHRFRMLELGLRVGTTIRVTQRSNAGGRVVARGPERIALDGQTAASILLNLK
ncbi:Ferrous iron transport protein A [Bifidobacterium dolichotidis]|uniref:Ferrous iron transport protein A n=1 Tax=Bifidobacterium dolichotidis TaxID=2306976 RepID=A0A430FSK9_9BIFI|nr:FeoA family protein [Bifidobacterium dolichotidis]RSX55841.1 Ferrous iron transport protein A [Bifidobacterium dolichotidis]